MTSINHSLEQLSLLRLNGFKEALQNQTQDPAYNALPFNDQLAHLLSEEILYRKNRIIKALVGQGKTRGKVARTRIDLTTNQSLGSLTFDERKINPDYVFHFLKTQYDNLRQISSGSGTRGGLNLQMI